MIYRLRKKFIGICIISFITVFLIVLALISLTTSLQINQTLDRYADLISQNDGRFPNFNGPDGNFPPQNGFNMESPFTTRYFTVRLDSDGNFISANVQHIASVSLSEAEEYGKSAIEIGRTRGWLDDYRYKLYGSGNDISVVFVSGVGSRENNQNFMLGTLSVFSVCSLVVIVLIIFISKRVVIPAAESYEKQKEFITNANHELKTPLTLIRANLDILEEEFGESEWLSDIRDETIVMSELVTQMVMLARMDEENTQLEIAEFDLSAAVSDTVCAFAASAEKSDKALSHDIAGGILYRGNEASISRVISILMDNALKYCDDGGEITVSLKGERHPILTVENTYRTVSDIELDRLFERFYRADKARTYGTGFGIGLSMAKAIVEKHRASISAYAVGKDKIAFRIKF